MFDVKLISKIFVQISIVSDLIDELNEISYMNGGHAGKGKAGTKLATDTDKVQHFFACNDHDSILLVSERFKYHVHIHLNI